MITKSQLKDLVNDKNRFKINFEVPWNETSLSRLYDKISDNFQCGSLIDIISVEPIEFIQERQSLIVEFELDISDALEEEGDD